MGDQEGFKAQAAHRGEIQRETIRGWDREEQEALWVVKGGVCLG